MICDRTFFVKVVQGTCFNRPRSVWFVHGIECIAAKHKIRAYGLWFNLNYLILFSHNKDGQCWIQTEIPDDSALVKLQEADFIEKILTKEEFYKKEDEDEN